MTSVLFTNVRILDLEGQIMMRGDELGQIREGHLADLLLVDGEPVAGAFHKDPQEGPARGRFRRPAA